MQTISKATWFILCFVLVLRMSGGSTFENCSISNNQVKYAILPGYGWDNLQNTEMGRILDLQFSKCKFSDDNKFLLPNGVSLYPKLSSEVEQYSEIFDHFMNYTSSTSKSVNIEAGSFIKDFKLGGHFSNEKERIKSYQLKTKSKISRVQLRYTLYKSIFEPDSPLHPGFLDRIIQLAKWIKKSTNETLYSSYLADMIIRDFGTHVIRSIDAGAILLKIDFLDENYVKNYPFETTTIEASSSGSFLKFFLLNGSIYSKVTEEKIIEYNKNCIKTIIKTFGGSPVGVNLDLKKWVSSVSENSVPIDRHGDPIYYTLNRKVLPNLSSNIIHKISNLLMDSVNRYYMANARKGCLNLLSSNFNSDANLDAEKCPEPNVSFTFGGVYVVCEGPVDQCRSVSSYNSLTNYQSCPDDYSAVKLHSGQNDCIESCWFFNLLGCVTECSYFKIYWCYPKTTSPNHKGYSFGGFIGSQMRVCPIGYFSLNLGSIAKLCVSSGDSATKPHALGFGGFFSCSVGNPLARSFSKNKSSPLEPQENWLYDCADGYVAHIATIDRNCQISYCTETNKFTLGSIPKLRRPPYTMVNDTSKVFYTRNGKMYVTNFDLNKIDNSIYNERKNSTIAIVFGTLFGVLLISVIAAFIHQCRKRIQSKHNFINSEGITNQYGGYNETKVDA